MEEHRNPIPKSRMFKRDGRRTARRRRELPDSWDPQVEEDKQAEQWSSGEKFIMEKVHEFFQECGWGDRGFITREDMQKLQQKFPFSSEELEVVFDKLDVDTKGILTPEQLTKGLSHFLSDQREVMSSDDPKVPPESLYQSHNLQCQVEVEDEEKQQFTALMQRLGAGAIFGDKSEIWKLWIQLRRNEPNLLGHLEDLLCKVTGQIQETLQEKEELEHTLRKKMAEHNADVRRLYEEMELQINKEEERIASESVVRFQAQSQDLQKELDRKQDEVQHLVQMQTQLQAELMTLHGKQEETNTENQELKQTNQEIVSQLEQMQQDLREARDRLENLKKDAAHREEKEGEWDQSLGREGPCTEAAVQQLQAELVSLRSEQEETSTKNQGLKLTNQELETRLEGIQRELQEARDRLEWKKGEWNQAPDTETLCSEEANQQDTGQRWGSGITQRNRKSEDLQSWQRKCGRTNRVISIEEEPLPPQDSGTQGSEVTMQEAGTRPVEGGDGVFDVTAGPPQREEATDPIKELQVELMSLRSEQEETSTENQGLKLTNQELETRLEGIQRELQEAQDRLEILQEEQRGQDQPSGSGSTNSDEAVQQLQAELVSLRSEQEETSTEYQELKLTNQELEMRLEGIQRELQEARDRLQILQEEAAHREEKEGERSQSLDIEQALADEAAQKLQAELVSLRSEQEETSTENQELKLTNQELETRLEGIQRELQEAQDRLEILQEEATHREEKEGERSQLLDIERAQADEVAQQLQAELVSLRSEQEETSTENQELKLTNQELETSLEGIQRELQEAQDQLQILQEETAQQEEKEGERSRSLDIERALADEAAQQLQAELVSLRSKQEETSTENQELKLTNQELETRLEGIQREMQEAQDQLEILQEEATHREEKEGVRSQLLDIEWAQADEVAQQLQAELVSLRSEQEETSTENQELKLTNQELETSLEGIQRELQEAQDRLEILQEETAQQEEKEGERSRSLDIERALADEAAQQLQAELVSLRSKQEETSTENQELILTNQELETRLEGIQRELQEAQDQLQILHEEGQRSRSLDIERALADEAPQQMQAELTALRSEQQETSTKNQEVKLTNQELKTQLKQTQLELQEARDRLEILQEQSAHQEEKEGLQRTRSIRRRAPPHTSSQQYPDLRVEGQEVILGRDGDGAREETAASDRAAERIKELEVELTSLRSKVDKTSTENQNLKLANQELQTQQERIQRDQLEVLQGETEGALDQTASSERPLSVEAVRQLQEELVSLRSEQEETSTENQELKLTNQELEMRLEGIQRELQVARDQVVILYEEAAHREEKEEVLDQSLGGEGVLCHETIQQLQVELMSLRSEQEETSTENQQLKLTNQELETKLEGIQWELQEARDQLKILQEEAAHQEEKEGLQRTRSIRRHAPPQVSSKLDPLGEVEGQEVTLGREGDEAREETEAASARDGGAERIAELQAELLSLRSEQEETSTENQELKLTNQELETRLEGIQRELQEARDRLEILQEEAAHWEEKEGLQRTRSIRCRAPPLVSSNPDTLGEVPHLRVEGQEVILGAGGDGAPQESAAASTMDGAAERIAELQAELVSLRSKQEETSAKNQELKLANQELKMQLEGIQRELQEARDQLDILQEEREGLHRTRSIRRRTTRDTSSDLGVHPQLRVEGQEVTLGRDGAGAHEETAARDGAAGRTIEADSSKDPDQVYNIMFLGNTNAGKTSFIQQFCDGNFQLGLPSTVGIDYRVKTLMVENRYIGLQLWDTAGQERFHSITKQFFRKADGIVVMYDVGSLSSFNELSYWMSCIKETVSEEVCILLLGNKMDVTANRQVRTVEGEQFAQEYNILFYECSACTGHNIIASMIHLSKLLRQQGERVQGKTVELVKKPTKKQKCCT